MGHDFVQLQWRLILNYVVLYTKNRIHPNRMGFVYILQQTEGTDLQLPAFISKTQFESLLDRIPDFNHFRIFGRVMKYVNQEKRLKWEKNAKEPFLVGYADKIKGYSRKGSGCH